MLGFCTSCCVTSRAKQQEFRGSQSSQWWGWFSSQGVWVAWGLPLPAWSLQGDPFSTPWVWTTVFGYSSLCGSVPLLGLGVLSCRLTAGRWFLHFQPSSQSACCCYFLGPLMAAPCILFSVSSYVRWKPESGCVTTLYLEPDFLVHFGVCTNKYVSTSNTYNTV